MCTGWWNTPSSSRCRAAAALSRTAPARVAVAILLSFLPLSEGRAQVEATTRQVDTTIQTMLQNASRIRVEFTDRRRFDGVFQELTPTQFRFRAIVRPTVQRAYFADLDVPRDSLSRIWVRSGSHWQLGALVGAAALGLTGFALGMAFKDDLDTPCSSNPSGCVAQATAVAATAGALTGGLLGAVIPRWRLVWPP